jgi:hypothetical protein
LQVSKYDLWADKYLLPEHGERMAAAGVCPHRGEGDLGVAALLQKQLLPSIEYEEAEGAVEEGGAVSRRQVARTLARLAGGDRLGYLYILLF